MSTSTTARRFLTSDLVRATGAPERTVRRYLQGYQQEHPTVRMRNDDGVWSVNSQTFNSLRNRITTRRQALGL